MTIISGPTTASATPAVPELEREFVTGPAGAPDFYVILPTSRMLGYRTGETADGHPVVRYEDCTPPAEKAVQLLVMIRQAAGDHATDARVWAEFRALATPDKVGPELAEAITNLCCALDTLGEALNTPVYWPGMLTISNAELAADDDVSHCRAVVQSLAAAA